MPLATIFTMTVPNNGLGITIAHGLSHGGASRTPQFVQFLFNQGNTAVTMGAVTMTFDSTSFVFSTGAAHLGVTVQVLLKRCHTIEDGPTF
jgi:hypothetical protein